MNDQPVKVEVFRMGPKCFGLIIRDAQTGKTMSYKGWELCVTLLRGKLKELGDNRIVNFNPLLSKRGYGKEASQEVDES